MTTHSGYNETYDLPPGFDEEPRSDATKLAQLFDENLESRDHELDFRFNPSSDKSIAQPRLLESTKSAAESVVVPITEPIFVDFLQFGLHSCIISVVNSEVLNFNNVVDAQLITQVSISMCYVLASEEDIVFHVNGSVFCRLKSYPELCAKLMAIFSFCRPVDPWVISSGNGETAMEDYKIQFNQLSYEFTRNELTKKTENVKKNLNLNSENLQDPILRQFLGKKSGARFVVGFNGVGTYFELKKLRSKRPRNISPVASESSEILQTPPPDRTEEIKERMKKIGAITLIPLESQVCVPPSNYDVPPELDAILEPFHKEEDKKAFEYVKPVPAARNHSNLSISNGNQTENLSSLEKRLEECEKKLATLSYKLETTSGVVVAPNFDRYEFAMDVYVKVAASETIPTAIKTEIKKLLLSAAIES